MDEAIKDSALRSIPLQQRRHWMVPTLIFGGLEFAIPVMMVGAALIANMSLPTLLLVAVLAMLIQWICNGLQGYMGARTGLASSVISRQSLGVVQARVVLGITVFFFTVGWGAVQIQVAANAMSTLLGVDYHTQWGSWAVITVIAGLIFALPSILGFSSMKWADVVAVPAGLLLVVTALYLSLRNTGLQNILAHRPDSSISLSQAMSMVIGLNVAQWLIASDYTRHSRPRFKDQALIPLGIISVGLPLLLVGAVMAIGGAGADIVQAMADLDFPLWGYVILCLSIWTSLLVNSYSMGLAISNTFNVHGSKGRAVSTFCGALACIGVALTGMISHFTDFLYITGLWLPPIVGVMFADFYLLGNVSTEAATSKRWDGFASLAIVTGVGVGYITQYVYPLGLPAVQSLLVSVAIYAVAHYPRLRLKHSPVT